MDLVSVADNGQQPVHNREHCADNDNKHPEDLRLAGLLSLCADAIGFDDIEPVS